MNVRLMTHLSAFPGPAVLRRLSMASMLMALAWAPDARGQDPVAAPASSAAVDMRAVFIDINGKVQWRPGEKEPWRDAKVNDEVEPGVEVRTGLRSHAALRMRNATVLLDAGTVFQLPTSVQDGDVLRTTAAIKHGRADFKVDKVGLSNDFKVVTPSTTLAVRGTEFAISTGALKQVEVVGARRNAINAIELKYALNNATVQLSGSATSSSSVNHPAHQSAVAASPPVAAAAAPPTTSQAEAVRTASAGESPVSSGSAAAVQQGNRSTARAEKASGSAGGSSGVVSRVQEQAELANARAEQAIAFLMQANTEAAIVAGQAEVLLGLQQLANARRQVALAQLLAHETARLEAEQVLGQVDGEGGYFAEFTALRRQVDGPGGQSLFAEFNSGADGADELLQQLSVLLPDVASGGGGDGGGGGGGGGGDASALIAQLRDALATLSENLSLAGDLRAQMDSARAAVAGLVELLDSPSTSADIRGRGLAARAAFEAAFASLGSALAAGTDAASVATDARSAVAALRALIVELSVASPTADLLASARDSLTRLQASSAALDLALGRLQGIRDARNEAANDDRRALLGRIEAIYSLLVTQRLQVMVGGVEQVDAGIALREARLTQLASDALPYLSHEADRIAFTSMTATLAGTAGAMADLSEMAAHTTRLEEIVSLSGDGLGEVQQQSAIADAARRDAGDFRLQALEARDNAEGALARILQAIDVGGSALGDVPATARAAASFAAAAGTAAGGATTAEATARAAADLAAALSSEASSLVVDIERFGTSREAFAAAIAQRTGEVNVIAGRVGTQRAEVNSYHQLVANELLARLNLTTEQLASSELGLAMAQANQVLENATQTANRAAELAETAGTNAQRLFFNGLQTYASAAASHAAAAQSSYIQAALLAADARGFSGEAQAFNAQAQSSAAGVGQQAGGGPQ
jgi:hypothetical protein